MRAASLRHNTPSSCFCKDSCALIGRVEKPGWYIGAVLVAALVLPVGALGASVVPDETALSGGSASTPARTTPAHTHTKSSTCTGANLLPTSSNAAAVDAATLCLIDQVRTAHHLGLLRANHALQTVAATQVDNMVRWNYFADDSPSGQTPSTLIAETYHPARAATSLSTAENIGWGTGAYATPAHIVAAWMASPPHREIILIGEYRNAGVGVTPAVPSVLAQPLPGATYAIELTARD